MGFLLGAFGKQMAGSNYRSIQAKLMKIQSRARKATRDVKRMEDMINRQAQMYKNSLQLQSQYTNLAASQSLMASCLGDLATKDYNTLSEDEKKTYQEGYTRYSQAMSQAQAQTSYMQAASQQQIEDYIQN